MNEELLALLSRLVDALSDGKGITAAERDELFRIAQGHACRQSAASVMLAVGTIRTRRKVMYRKLGVHGAKEVLAGLLALALEQVAHCSSDGSLSMPPGVQSAT